MEWWSGGLVEYWSDGVMEFSKSQITNHKIQTNKNDRNSKSQTTQHKTFWSLIIEIWDLFGIWCLEFGILKSNNRRQI
jgi:hypothetical protein